METSRIPQTLHSRLTAGITWSVLAFWGAEAIVPSQADEPRIAATTVAGVEGDVPPITLNAFTPRFKPYRSGPQAKVCCQFLQVNLREMAQPYGIALLRESLGAQFDEKASPSSQVVAALGTETFLNRAQLKRLISTYHASEVVAAVGQEKRWSVEGKVTSPLQGSPSGERGTAGISLMMTPTRLDADRIEIDFSAEVRRHSEPTAESPIGEPTPIVRRGPISTVADIRLGETLAISGFVGEEGVFEVRGTRRNNSKTNADEKDHRPGFEVLMLLTAIPPTGTAPAAPGLDAATSRP